MRPDYVSAGIEFDTKHVTFMEQQMDEHTESSQKISNSLWFGVLHRRGPKNADGPTNKKTRPDTRLP